MAAEQRKQMHIDGKKLMMKGEYYPALEIFHTALADHGPHVGLISDIASLYYMMGRMEDWSMMTRRLENELQKAKPLLAVDNLVRAKILLGKMLEEQAEVERALSVYNLAEEAADLYPGLRLKAQAQKLRLQSFLGIRSGLAEMYKWVSTAQAESKHFNIEFEHALILAEMVLFGMESASQRMKDLFAKQDLPSWDLRLLYIDFIEESLRQNSTTEDIENLEEKVPLADCDEFEKAVMLLKQNQEFKLSVGDINKLSSSMPLMGLLRLMTLQVARTPDTELQRRILFLMDSLTPGSRALLNKKWQLELASGHRVLYFSASENSLFIKGQALNFKKSSFANRCFELFSEGKAHDIEKFVSHVFEADYNESYFDRTRIALQRLNKELITLAGVQKVFILRKNSVEMIEGIQIRKT